MRSYLSIYQVTNKFYNNKSTNIDYLDYGNGYAIWGFDLSDDQCDDDYYREPESGNIKIEIKFSKVLPIGITAVVYADYNCMFSINSAREVSIDYIP